MPRKPRWWRKPRRQPLNPRKPDLTETQILAWADGFHARTGRWPTAQSGHITGSLGENWLAVDANLRRGGRGLPGKSSLPRLLAERRGKRNHLALPHLTIKQILAWADEHHRRQGVWPTQRDGAIAGAPGESWTAVEASLEQAGRGLPAGWTLPRLLDKYRGLRNIHALPRLSAAKILAWIDQFHARTGHWPNYNSGPIPGTDETWGGVHRALLHGIRGMPGRSSLAQFLTARRGLRNSKRLPPLTRAQVLAWADEHKKRTGRWPGCKSGPIPGTGGETWRTVGGALAAGKRRLGKPITLPQLLTSARGTRNIHGLPPLTHKQILAWMDRYHERHGRWPHAKSGPIPEAPGETWATIEGALRGGRRGLGRRSSMAQLRAAERGVPNNQARPPLVPHKILAWARSHHRRTGSWPRANSGPVVGVANENWQAIDAALRVGVRALPGGTSLFRFLCKHGCA